MTVAQLLHSLIAMQHFQLSICEHGLNAKEEICVCIHEAAEIIINNSGKQFGLM